LGLSFASNLLLTQKAALSHVAGNDAEIEEMQTIVQRKGLGQFE